MADPLGMTPEMWDAFVKGGNLGSAQPSLSAATPANSSFPGRATIESLLRGGAAPAAPSATGGLWGALTKPRAVGDVAKLAGRGALMAGKAGLKALSTPATWIPSIAGMTASKMAGGDLMTGLDPAMFARALGEGYAQRAPTWMGGLTDAEIAAARSEGAGDIEGRFGAVPGAVVPRAPVTVDSKSGLPVDAGAYDPTMAGFNTPAVPATNVLPPIVPFTSADIDSNRVPAFGTGAFRNTRTGAVTNLDTRGSPGPGAVPSVPQDAGNVVARGTGAMMNIKERTGAAVQQQAQGKLLLELLMKQPGMTKDAAEAAALQARLKLAGMESDPARAAAITMGRAATEPQFSVPLAAMPDAKTGALPVLQTRGPGAGAIRQVTPQRMFTKADLEFNMKNSGKPRAQILRDARAAGHAIEAGL